MAEMARVALFDWLTIPEAAARVGTSERTIERRITAGEIETRPRPRPGRRPETVCHPRDIEKLMPKAHVMLAGEPPDAADSTSHGLARINEERFTFAYVLQEILRRNAGPAPAPLPWITLEEAAAASGLSAGFLRRMVREEKIEANRGGPHGALRIQRASLEQFSATRA